jgi:hypothetical protein
MEIVKVDEIAVIKAGEHFMIIIGEKMYGKFHISKLHEIVGMFEERRGKNAV